MKGSFFLFMKGVAFMKTLLITVFVMLSGVLCSLSVTRFNTRNWYNIRDLYRYTTQRLFILLFHSPIFYIGMLLLRTFWWARAMWPYRRLVLSRWIPRRWSWSDPVPVRGSSRCCWRPNRRWTPPPHGAWSQQMVSDIPTRESRRPCARWCDSWSRISYYSTQLYRPFSRINTALGQDRSATAGSRNFSNGNEKKHRDKIKNG